MLVTQGVIVFFFFCLHCNFLRPDSKDAISNETCTGALFFSTIHIHLLIHAHCISICFPPITSITQSQSLCEHIFHLSLFSLSFINLNISTPDDWFWTNTQQPRRRRACSVMCGVHFFLLAFKVFLKIALSSTSPALSPALPPSLSRSRYS